MANRKAVGPDDLPAELIKLFLDGDRGFHREFHAIVVDAWQTGNVPQQWKDATIKVLFKKGERRSAATTGASLSLLSLIHI